MTFDQIEAVRGLLEPGKSGKVVEIPGGIEVSREFGRLAFRGKSVATADYSYELKIPGQVHIPEVGKVFRAEIVEIEANEQLARADEVRIGRIVERIREQVTAGTEAPKVDYLAGQVTGIRQWIGATSGEAKPRSQARF